VAGQELGGKELGGAELGRRGELRHAGPLT
jgi:hypothetical protein